MTDMRGKRSEYLLGGRRVKVSDLLSAGLIQPGAQLTFRRRKDKDHRRASVLESGRLQLEDGRTYASLSRAAAVAAGVRALDGWHAWVVEGSGKSIDSLRQQLLDQAVSEVPPDREPESASDGVGPRPRHERLKEFRVQADAGQPTEMTVRELLTLWGATARGHQVGTRIEDELANHGLTTSPHWQKVDLDSEVRLELRAHDDNDEVGNLDGAGSLTDDDLQDVEVGQTVGNLPSAFGGVCSVSPHATIEEAVTLMLLNDYSQLAVLSGRHNLKGAITWKSIAQARHLKPSASLAAAVIPAELVPYDRELTELLPTLNVAEFVFVRDETNEICGIVTASDVVSAYGQLATPFLLIGQLDQLLRRLISDVFDLDQVVSLCELNGSRTIKSFDDLTIGDYQQVLQNPDRWAQLGWPLDRSVFCKRLDELREVRNDVMHFNPDPVPPNIIDQLRGIIRLLREYGDLS